MKLTASIEQVLTVADALSQLPEPHAFVGGAIVGLYLTDPAAQPPCRSSSFAIRPKKVRTQ